MRSLTLFAALALGCGSSAGGGDATANGPPPNEAGSTPDGGALDGAGTDAGPSDAGAGGDASADAGGSQRIACGTGSCRSDESCVKDTCMRACTGATVPGDYATVDAAVKALAQTGTDATICLLGAGAQPGEPAIVDIEDTGSHGATLRIVGVQSGRATLERVGLASGFKEIVLEGFEVTKGVTVTGGVTASLRAMKLDASSGAALEISQGATARTIEVMVDGSEIAGPGGTGVNVYTRAAGAGGSGSIAVTIANSFIHGAYNGVWIAGAPAGAAGAPTTVTIVNDTFDQEEVHILAESPDVTLAYSNDILAHATKLGVNLFQTKSFTHSHNAFFGNASNYAGTATDGAGYVKQDCALSAASPVPEPSATSPCRGAADPATAPAVDYWNAQRGSAPDIGAVQVK